jgi:hypothetical protein
MGASFKQKTRAKVVGPNVGAIHIGSGLNPAVLQKEPTRRAKSPSAISPKGFSRKTVEAIGFEPSLAQFLPATVAAAGWQLHLGIHLACFGPKHCVSDRSDVARDAGAQVALVASGHVRQARVRLPQFAIMKGGVRRMTDD